MGRQSDQWWQQTWEGRTRSACDFFNIEFPPNELWSLQQDDPESMVPGACVIGGIQGADSIYFTLGLTQPLDEGGTAFGWEAAVYTSERGAWAVELLADLMHDCQRARNKGVATGAGDSFPISLFRDATGALSASIMSPDPRVLTASEITVGYLWPDQRRPYYVPCSTGKFHFMTVVGATGAEGRLADATSPPHLIAALHICGLGQTLRPTRKTAVGQPEFDAAWTRVRELPYDGLMSVLREERHRRGV